MTAEEFLDLIHGPDAAIYFQVAAKTWKNKPQTFRQAESKLRWRNGLGEDIGFLVNSGGTKDAQIVKVNAVFVDWDCGRDVAGRYFADAEAKSRKVRYLPTLCSFVPKASIIVETRNGFHAYWLLEPGVTPDQFRHCQRRLAAALSGDSAVSNPARVMRLPGFDWTKPTSGCARFPVTVLTCSGARYQIQEILDRLPQDNQPLQEASSREGAHNKCKCVSTLALTVGAKPPPTSPPLSFASIGEALDHLKMQDLGEYLTGIQGTPDDGLKMRCPFHADANPSAGVFRARLTGHWLFRCHGCNISGTIIDMAMRLHQCAEGPALKLLFARYRIEIDTGWKADQHEVLQQNLMVIDDAERLKDRYPNLYRLIGRVTGDLRSKIQIAQEFLVSERSQFDGNAVFFSSLRNFHRAARGETAQPKYCNRQNEKVDRYCLLGLMKKLQDDQIPSHLLKEAMTRQMTRAYKYRIQFYSIPAYTAEMLDTADKRAHQLISAGASVRGLSPELVRDLFGSETACEIYPQIESPVRGSPSAFRAAVQKAVMSAVADKGYATSKQIRAQMLRQDEWASVTTRRIEKCLPGILLALTMVKRIANRQLKQQLGITARGYPKVIMPKL